MKNIFTALQMLLSLSALAYERYPVRAEGVRLEDENAYIFLIDAGESNAPVVECVTDLESSDWTRPIQTAWNAISRLELMLREKEANANQKGAT